ncbi:MAG: family 43 glycosylhydrolase [Lachnospiraceae bacterium]|nr:family 43 glycosylhydrolase [Lachnospiraceae bacterium]
MKASKQIFNPYLPSYEYIPDGEPYIFDDRLYIYGSHDRFGGDYYCMNDYVCWSAPLDDLSDFRYEGVIYKKDQHPYPSGKGVYFAPDVTRGKDGRYYLYYSVAHSSIMSVAVCDTPAGRYEYLGDVHYPDGRLMGEAAGEYYQFDPAIFIDDDGRIFLYSGFCPTNKYEDEEGRRYVGCHVAELEEDMLTVKAGPKLVIDREDYPSPDNQYFEAPSMRRIKGRYYLVYSVKVGGLHYCISDKPDGGFVYGGRIHSTSDIGINGHYLDNPVYPNGNTHGGIVELDGRYYIFNHRMTNNSSYCRQGVAEEIFIAEDGHIAQVEATSCGLNDGPLVGEGTYPAYIACALMDFNEYTDKEEKSKLTPRITQEGEDRECEPGQFIKNIRGNCLVGYKYFKFKACESVIFKLRGKAEGNLCLMLTEKGQPVTDVPLRLDSEDWQEVKVPFEVTGDRCGFYLIWQGEGTFDLLDFTFV